MDFWKAYKKLKSGEYVTRRKPDSCIYDRREILYYDSSIGILSLDSRIKNISHIELDATDWTIVSKKYLSEYHTHLTNENKTMLIDE